MLNKRSNIFPNGIIILLLLLSSCKEDFVKSRLTTTRLFLKCLSSNRPELIGFITYSGVDDNIDDPARRKTQFANGHEVIKRFGIPPEEQWIIQSDPDNNIESMRVTIPLFKGYDSVLKVKSVNIVVKFPPKWVSKKIYAYDIERDIDWSKVKFERPTGPMPEK